LRGREAGIQCFGGGILCFVEPLGVEARLLHVGGRVACTPHLGHTEDERFAQIKRRKLRREQRSDLIARIGNLRSPV
jgi:hypothetical protein